MKDTTAWLVPMLLLPVFFFLGWAFKTYMDEHAMNVEAMTTTQFPTPTPF